jgi:hypothetical protein
VVTLLKHHPIVVGGCQITNGSGQPKEYVPNVGRNLFDVFKYWVPYSIPTQPAIFFRRALLETVRYAPGTFVDPKLHYCMDYDLWLRMLVHHDLCAVETTFAYYRMYENNKTSEMSRAEPEMRMVHQKHRALLVSSGDNHAPIDRSITFFGSQAAFKENTGALQGLHATEILFGRSASETQHSLEPSALGVYDYFDTFCEQVCARARGELIYLLPPNTTPALNLIEKVEQHFSDNRVGAVVLRNKGVPTEMLRPGAFFDSDVFLEGLVFRRVLLKEFETLLPIRTVAKLRALLFCAVSAGWVGVREDLNQTELALTFCRDDLKSTRNYYNALSILTLLHAAGRRPFLARSLPNDLAPLISREVIEGATRLLHDAGPQWEEILCKSHEELQNYLTHYPNYAPGWQRLVASVRKRSDQELLAYAEKGLTEACARERTY